MARRYIVKSFCSDKIETRIVIPAGNRKQMRKKVRKMFSASKVTFSLDRIYLRDPNGDTVRKLFWHRERRDFGTIF